MKQYDGYTIISDREWEEWQQEIVASVPQMTEEQQKVTQARNRDILVSAAAGSGKTWVLVQRILCRMVEEHLDIHQFLIVTFTKAAAAEMRERIGKAIQEHLDKAISKHSEGEADLTEEIAFFTRQTTLVYQAQISTIDSFCGDIVKQYFMRLSIDPNYRIAEEAELAILQNQVMEEILEQEYEKGEEAFLHFVECYAPGRDDKKIESLILKLYQFQISHPDPEAWIQESISILKDSQVWYQILLEHCGALLDTVLTEVQEAIIFARTHDGDDKVISTLNSDKEYFETLAEAFSSGSFDKSYRCICAHGKYAVLYKKSMDPEDGEQLRKKREAYKTLVKKQIEERYFKYDYETMEQERQVVIPDMQELLRLSSVFRKAYEKAKREQAIADFSDVEHMALSILTKKQEDGSIIPSDVAQKLQGEYAEIMVDEYQDSNYLQEAILSSIAHNNMFMVGDMKQSIYRFRMARPELFVGKYKNFAVYEGNQQKESQVKIELDRNFRSSANVLESINYIFYHIMGEGIGGVEYDRKASLKAGAAFSKPILKESQWADRPDGYYYNNDMELLLYEAEEETGENADLLREEARMVAVQIQSMMAGEHHMLVKDTHVSGREEEQYRPLRYRDIVILMRSPSNCSDTFVQVLNDAGIPAFVESNKGYFSAIEVQTVLSYLKALNNGTDDIAVTAVLRNYFGDCTAAELALLTCDTKEMKDCSVMERIRFWCKETEHSGEHPKLYEKLSCFLEQYERYQEQAQELSVGDLISYIYEDSGYLDYVSALPAGERRAANLMMLVQKARAYEQTNFRGLFQFVRYMEQLHQYEVDFGEANLLSENDDVVRIMSIHKSKGLEFPVVFVSNLSKNFNEMDLRSDVLLHADLGVGPNIIDPVLRTRHKTIMRDILTLVSRRDMLGEELRVLYVALTRAKDKCILTGAVTNWMEYLEKIPVNCGYSSVYAAKSYLQWILMALCHHSVLQEAYRDFGLEIPEYDEHRFSKAVFSFTCVHATDLDEHYVLREVKRLLKEEELQAEAARIPKEKIEHLYQRLNSSYQWDWAINQPGKYSVSQIKEHRIHQMESGEEGTMEDIPELEGIPTGEEEEEIVSTKASVPAFSEPTLPRFLQKEQTDISGALKGTCIHKFMELYDFTKGFLREEYERVCDVMEERQIPEIRGLLPLEKIQRFFESCLAQEMVQAAGKGTLQKEAQFVVGFPAAEVLKDMSVSIVGRTEERILVQGIIDAYYENNDGNLVIMDYKTDRVQRIEELCERYGLQLTYYKKTLEQITGKKVDRCVLYSFFQDSEIECEL